MSTTQQWVPFARAFWLHFPRSKRDSALFVVELFDELMGSPMRPSNGTLECQVKHGIYFVLFCIRCISVFCSVFLFPFMEVTAFELYIDIADTAWLCLDLQSLNHTRFQHCLPSSSLIKGALVLWLVCCCIGSQIYIAFGKSHLSIIWHVIDQQIAWGKFRELWHYNLAFVVVRISILLIDIESERETQTETE